MSKNEFAMKIIAIGLSHNIPEQDLRAYYGEVIEAAFRHGIPDTEIRQYYGNSLVNKYFSHKSQEAIYEQEKF